MEVLHQPRSFGSYKVFAKIGHGGMAEVFLGASKQKELQNQFIAIKKLLPHLNSNKPFVNLLIHEAKIGVLINHPGIVGVYDLGSYKSEFFMAMEFIHGKSLDKVLEKIKQSKTPKLSLEISSFVVLEVLRALSFAHQLKDGQGRDLNIVHRDITPGNIMISYRGEVKLADFGIAIAESRLHPNLQQQNFGKMAYMSPEQAANDPVSRTSDLYSLGVVFYELLTGQLPIIADSAATFYKKLIEGKITGLRLTGPTIAQDLRDIVSKLLNRSPTKRYLSAPELYQKLVEYFKRELEIDFTSKDVRFYYKKKLAENMRQIFQEEILNESKVIDTSLQMISEEKDLLVTAPQDVSAFRQIEELDKTSIQADYTNNETRALNLSESERQKILQGLPEKKMASGDHYQVATIPEYDLAQDHSSAQRISVKEKLKFSSLDRDNRETLSGKLPALEIGSDDDLAAFEELTLSNPKTVASDPEQTRHFDRDEVLRDFEKIKTSGPQSYASSDKTEYDESAKVAASLYAEARSTVTVHEDILPPKPQEGASPPPAKLKPDPSGRLKPFLRMSRIALLASVALGSLAVWIWTLDPWKSVALMPTQRIGLIVVSEASPDVTMSFLQSIQGREEFSLPQIESLFLNSYQKYTGRVQIPVKISFQKTLYLSAPVEPNGDIFPKLKALAQPGKDFDSTIYLYIYPYTPGTPFNPLYPEEYKGARPHHTGIVYVPAHSTQRLNVLIHLAREIAVLYGATDKMDPGSGQPQVPYGIAKPDEKPLYPQAKAELMAPVVPTAPDASRPPKGLYEILIGPKTATELGWLKPAKN